MLLADKTAVVHGGSGAIGGAVARTFAREGARLFLTGRNEAKLRKVADDIIASGGKAEIAVFDALDEVAVTRHMEETAERAGRVDIALNALGIPHVQGPPLAELSYEDFALPIAAFTRTNFLTAKAAAHHMARQGAGVILTLSSPGARMTGIGFLGYGVTCGAIETFSRLLAGELGASGVRVICLRPDAIPEALPHSYARSVFEGYAARSGIAVETMLAARAENGTLLKRFPSLAEIADYAAFAASDRAGAMTGVIANLTCGSLVD